MKIRYPVLGMAGLFLGMQLLAMCLSQPFQQVYGPALPAPPESPYNPIYIYGLLLGFTGIFLVLIKKRQQWLLDLIVVFSCGYLIWYGLHPFLDYISIPIAFGTIAVLRIFPEWWIIDAAGILIGASTAAIMGISMRVAPILGLLVAAAIYDAIAVYRTKHMVGLAEAVLKLKLPLLLVVPRKLRYSLKPGVKLGSGEALMMGLGDAIFPGMLAVSALSSYGWMIGLTVVLGSLAGFGILSKLLGSRPHAGLPFLNGGAIAGLLVGLGFSS